MAKVSAFKGWRYNTDNISNIEDVIVPPYDVITPKNKRVIIINLLIIIFVFI